MPSYHENCGKPGPKSLSYNPPPESRIFKSRSAPASPFFHRSQPFNRSAKGSVSFREPRQTRASSLLRESQKRKAEKYKADTSSKLGRSKSFTSRITSKLHVRSKTKSNFLLLFFFSCNLLARFSTLDLSSRFAHVPRHETRVYPRVEKYVCVGKFEFVCPKKTPLKLVLEFRLFDSHLKSFCSSFN